MPNRALFFWGGWEGHEPKACTEFMAQAVEAAGLVPEVHEGLDVLNDAAHLRSFRVIVPCFTMGQLSGEQEQNLVSAISDGVGLAGWHGGVADAFRASTNYQWMVGGQFVAHPGNIIDYIVDIIRPEHPITRGIPSFEIRSEQYLMHVDPSNDVLATTTFSGGHASWTTGLIMPVVWTRRHDKGRVAVSALGHVRADLERPEVLELTKRCILFAAGLLG